MIAQTILQQLGGGRFLAMTGAKYLLDLGNGIQFRLPKQANKINSVRIVLNADDTYDIEWFRIGRSLEVVKKHEGIYCDQLRELFEKTTGLFTSL